MDYGKYKNARNASWQCIIDYNINSLPVLVTDIAKRADVEVIKNSTLNLLNEEVSGATIVQNDKFYIIYRDTENSCRCRFTIAHELGHIFLGHLLVDTPKYRTFTIQSESESEANVFDRDLLAPACVLHELNIVKARDIAEICNISLEAAGYREERMKELESRNAWYFNPLERKVIKQFKGFIKEKIAE